MSPCYDGTVSILCLGVFWAGDKGYACFLSPLRLAFSRFWLMSEWTGGHSCLVAPRSLSFFSITSPDGRALPIFETAVARYIQKKLGRRHDGPCLPCWAASQWLAAPRSDPVRSYWPAEVSKRRSQPWPPLAPCFWPRRSWRRANGWAGWDGGDLVNRHKQTLGPRGKKKKPSNGRRREEPPAANGQNTPCPPCLFLFYSLHSRSLAPVPCKHSKM